MNTHEVMRLRRMVETGAARALRLEAALDFPGGSARILAIAMAAPEGRFETVLEAAAPIVDSFESRSG